MKTLIWNIHEIRYQLAKWRADRHIARAKEMIKIMRDACERQKRIMEVEE